MVVVVALAPGDHGDPLVVTRIVIRVKSPLTKRVANGIDREGRVIDEEHADKAAPEEPLSPTDEVGNKESEDDPEVGGLVDENDHWIFGKTPSIELTIRWVSSEEPAHMSVEEIFRGLEPAFSVSCVW